MTAVAACTFHAITVGEIDSARAVPPAIAALLGPNLVTELRANPDTTGNTPCLFCLTDDSGRVVSWIRGWADLLFVNGQTVPWVWTGDLTTIPELRGRGLATRLQKESTEWVRARHMARGSVFSTDDTLRIYQRLGYLLPGYASRTVLVRSVRPIVAGHVSKRWLRRFATIAAQPVATLAARVVLARCVRWASGTRAEVYDGFHEPAIRALLDAAARGMPVRFSMSPAKLQWKLEHAARKGGSFSILAVSSSARKPLALALVRTREEVKPLAGRYGNFRCTTVMDFLFADGSQRTARALLAHMCRHFLQSSDGEVLQLISHNARLTRMARRLGFIPAGRGMSFACTLPNTIEPPAAASAISTWPVTHFSGDGPFL